MLNKMYDIMDADCKTVSDIIGVSVKFPRPGKRALRISSVTNGLIGAGCILFGTLSPHKWIIVLGGLGVASSFIINSKVKSRKE